MTELKDLLDNASDDVKELYEQKYGLGSAQYDQVDGRDEVPSRSKLESRFVELWKMLCPEIDLEEEYHFHHERKWRFDFAHPNTRIAIEIEGGVWSRGRHTRGSGFIADCDKYNTAAYMGWTVFRLPEALLTATWVQRIGALMELKEAIDGIGL